MPGQHWRNTNVNFSGANSAMTNASRSMGQAGQLAKGLVDSITQQERVKQQQQQLDYILDTENRNKRVEQYNYDLKNQRINHQNQSILEAENTAYSKAQNDLSQQFNDYYANQVVKAQATTGLNVGDFGPAHPGNTPEASLQNENLKNKLLTPDAKQQMFEMYKTNQPPVDRKALYNNTLQQLIQSNTGLPLDALQAKAMEYTNSKLGAQSTKEMLEPQLDAAKNVYTNSSNLIKEFVKQQGKGSGKNTIGISIGSNGSIRSTGRNSNGVNYSVENNPEAFNKWLDETVDKKHNSLWTVFTNAFGSNQSVNKQDVKDAYLYYKKYFPQVTDKQFMAYFNGAIKDGLVSGQYAPEQLFPGSLNTPPTRKQVEAVNQMLNMGMDKTNVRSTTGYSAQGTPQEQAQLLKLSYQQQKALMNQQHKLDQEYLKDISTISNSTKELTPKQKFDKLFKQYINPVSPKQPVSDSREQLLKHSSINKEGTKLFKDKSNPIAKAMTVKDTKNTSSLAKYLTNHPDEYKEYFNKLNKAEQAKVTKYVHTDKFKTLAKQYYKNHSSKDVNKNTDKIVNPKNNNTDALLAKYEDEGYIPATDIQDVDSIKLRQAGYIPEYNGTGREIIGWKNPHLIQKAKDKENTSNGRAIRNMVNPTGSKGGIVLPFDIDTSPTVNSTYQNSLLHR